MDKKTNFSYLASITAGLFFGSIPVISAILRDLNVSSIEQSLLRIFFGSIFGLGIIVFYTLKKNKEQVKNSIKLTNQKTYLLQSLIFVMMIVVYLSSIAVGTPAGEAALLIQIHPFITLILGRIFLKERITKSKILAIIVATAGLITLTEVWKWESFMSSIVGTTLAILNGLFYAFYLLVGRASAEKRKKRSLFPINSLGDIMGNNYSSTSTNNVLNTTPTRRVSKNGNRKYNENKNNTNRNRIRTSRKRNTIWTVDDLSKISRVIKKLITTTR